MLFHLVNLKTLAILNPSKNRKGQQRKWAKIWFLEVFMVKCGNMATCIFCEANGEGGSENFLLKEILLVEEEDDGGIAKPLVVADWVEQFQTFLHSVLKRDKCISFLS